VVLNLPNRDGLWRLARPLIAGQMQL